MGGMLLIGKPTQHSKAATGEPYVEFAAGIRLKNTTEAKADETLLAWMWLAFVDYLRKTAAADPLSPLSLYWRIWPELVTFDGNENHDPDDRSEREPDPVRRIYLRYLISTKPEKVEYFEPI